MFIYFLSGGNITYRQSYCLFLYRNAKCHADVTAPNAHPHLLSHIDAGANFYAYRHHHSISYAFSYPYPRTSYRYRYTRTADPNSYANAY